MSIASSFLNDQDSEHELKSFSHLLAGAMSPSDAAPTTSASANPANPEDSQTSSMDGVGSNSPARSFAERLAARGAAASVTNQTSEAAAEVARPPPPNARYNNLPPPSSLPNPGNAYLTIPPGLSPTTLFDPSPVMLSNSQVPSHPVLRFASGMAWRTLCCCC
jgi:hypothetical protein